MSKTILARKLFELAASAQARGWSAEELLSAEIKRHERAFRRWERVRPPRQKPRAAIATGV